MAPENDEHEQPKKSDLLEHVRKGVSLWLVIGILSLINVSAIFAYFVRVVTPPQAVPIGTIIAWNGKGSLPDGWAICDGNKDTTTPDLRGLFLKGVGSSADANVTTHTIIIAQNNGFYAGTATRTGVTAPDQSPVNIPPNYTVVYIMKVK